jgi:hypothetical protein
MKCFWAQYKHGFPSDSSLVMKIPDLEQWLGNRNCS